MTDLRALAERLSAFLLEWPDEVEWPERVLIVLEALVADVTREQAAEIALLQQALATRDVQAEAALAAALARVAELEEPNQPQPDPALAVDLAAFLNVTGEAVADALAAAGCRLTAGWTVERDPSASAEPGGE